MNGRRSRGFRWAARKAHLLVLACPLLSACAIGASPPPSAERASAGMTSDESFEVSVNAARAYREHRWADAGAMYARLAQFAPSDAHTLFRLGNTLARQGKVDRAIDAYEQALLLDASDARPWFNLSTAYLMKAQRSLSQSWHAMERGDPQRPMIERRLGSLGELMGAAAGDTEQVDTFEFQD